MRKASTVMKKTFNHGTTTGKPSTSSSTASTGDIGEEQHHSGLDTSIVPSTSSFTLAPKEDKPEKLKKKAKNFLDDRQKIKTRSQSLWSFIDAAHSFDQARFFQENSEQVFRVVYESCMHHIEKIKHKSERPQSWSSKELANLQKALSLLRKLFLFVPELMRNGWQRKNIATILAHILDHGNHIRLRALGFHLLLLWLNDQVVEYPECIELFANAISLDLFVLDDIATLPPGIPGTSTEASTPEEKESAPKTHSSGLQFVKKLSERHADRAFGQGLIRHERIKSSKLRFGQSLIAGDDQAPLFPNPSPPTYNDSIVLFHIFITNLVRLAYVAAGSPPPPDDYEYNPNHQFECDGGIATGVGIDAATASAKFLFKIFRTYYLAKFVPAKAKLLGVEAAAAQGSGDMDGFLTCPPSILRLVLRFLIGYCLDNNNNPQIHWMHMPANTVSLPATPILKSIVLSSHETREMLHEILRQSVVLPSTNPEYRDITRGAVHILGVWMLGSEDERPSFLRRTGGGLAGQSSMTRSSSMVSVATSKNSASEVKDAAKTLSASPTSSLGPLTKTADKQELDYADANVFLRRYFLMIKLVFEDHSTSDGTGHDHGAFSSVVYQATDWDGLISLYKDTIGIYRAISVARGGIDMESESWELLLRCLLDIQRWFMGSPERLGRIPVQSLAEDWADYICETLLHSFVRARLSNLSMWQDLKEQMMATMKWTQGLSQWVKIMHKLTRVLSLRLYKVEYDTVPGQGRHMDGVGEDLPGANRGSFHFGSTPPAGRNRNKVRSRHLSIQGDHRQSSRGAGRPLSAGGSDGQLMETSHQLLETAEEHAGNIHVSMAGVLRNASSASLTEMANYRVPDQQSGHFSLSDTHLMEEGHAEDERHQSGISGSSSTSRTGGNIKFGIKNIIPTGSFSATHNPSQNNNIPTVPAMGGSVGASSRRSGRRTMSIHQLDTLWQDSGSRLLNFVQHTAGSDSTALQPSSSKAPPGSTIKEEDGKTKGEWDKRSTGSSIERPAHDEMTAISSKSNRTSVSTLLGPEEPVLVTTSATTVNEKLPSSLGIFRNPDFLFLQSLSLDGLGVLAAWKNMLCSIGNINHIQGPHHYAMAMHCVVDIWDTLLWVRAHQPYRNVPIPAFYEVTPWLLQATDLPDTYDTGRAAAFGCLCRLMSRKPEEAVPASYYAHFYKVVFKGLASNDATIIQAIITHSERLFAFNLPGVHILIPPFIHAVESQLLDGIKAREVTSEVRRSCITILGSLVSMSNHFASVEIKTDELEVPWAALGDSQFQFKNVKWQLKDLLIRLVDTGSSMRRMEQDIDAHCMLLNALSALVLDELLANQTHPDHELVDECVSSLVNHLYGSSITVLNTVCDCLVTLSQMYSESLDPDGMIVQEVLTKMIDALNVHLRYYKNNSKSGRGFIISKLFSCLLEWLMTIEPEILTDTELCQLVFDVIELAFYATSEGNEKLLPHPPVVRSTGSKKREMQFKFKLLTEKRPDIENDQMNISAGSDAPDGDHSHVKESAEALLFHLLHHFNNFAPPYGAATTQSTILGPGVSTEGIDYQQYHYFSFNDSTIMALAELPHTETRGPQARMVLRDLTGRYVWDTQLEPKCMRGRPESETTEEEPDYIEGILDKEQGFRLNPSVHVLKETIDKGNEDEQRQPDVLGQLLCDIGESNPDCLLDEETGLNEPAPPSELQMGMVGRLGEQLNSYLENEVRNMRSQENDVQLWCSKLNVLRRREIKDEGESTHAHLAANFSLRKDFLPAFPHEAEKTQVPFQQSRLLMSHFGFMNHDLLKDGSFSMLNKTPALYRDLRGLDRKHGRETMKIAVIYVAQGQDDEQTILHNRQGSPTYDAFVNSLGWEIDIATHTGYLGGLERNLTNGTRANYFCSSTLEMIFHDVTKMPTDSQDPKQLKKKRHVGNDHVHIIWNEHHRDYRIGTIGGDFGNAQIVVSPLPNGLFAVQVYRDPKIPYFGPLFNGMIVSQATLGPLVRATAIDAFRASVHTNTYSFYKSVFAQRANDVRMITQRHRIEKWNYEQFVEKIFMPNES